MGEKIKEKNRILTELPKKYRDGKEVIEWKKTVGMNLELFYEGDLYNVKVVKYNSPRIWIDYNGYIYDKGVCIGNFIKGSFGGVLKLVTSEFKIEIDQIFKDDKRDLTITDREYRKKELKPDKKKRIYVNNEKWYKYKCLKCGYEGWMTEGNLDIGNGCACCANRVAVLGVNTVYDVDSWVMKLGLSKEDAKSNLPQSNKKIEITCPDCGRKKKIQISNLYKTKSIGCDCSDKKSYIVKYIMSVLNQLRVEYQTEVKYGWNKYTNPLTNKLSQASVDFVIYYNGREIPLEADGEFHRKDNYMNGVTKEMSEYIDKQRDENCLKRLSEETIRISDEGDVKENILNSKLNELFDLSKIDWNRCEEFALKNLVKEVCDYWNQKEELETTNDLSCKFKISRKTIIEYLNRGTKLNWCNYDPKEESRKSGFKSGKSIGKPVEMFKDGQSLGIFESGHELSRQSENLFGVKLNNSLISSVCRGCQKSYKGYTFKYI